MTPEEREYMRRVIEANERESFRAKLEDMGEDNCPVCLANRRREVWGADPVEET